jgi:hypothetical protein
LQINFLEREVTFRIDLGKKDGADIFLVVVRNQININFAPADPANPVDVIPITNRFQHLLTHFKLSHKTSFVRGEDAEHVKRHHGTADETDVHHLHLAFTQDVTPHMFTEFMSGLLSAQADHRMDKEYQFIGSSAAENIENAFNTYYQEYNNSNLQQQCKQERRLTKHEALSLFQAAKKSSSNLSVEDEQELGQFGIRVEKPPVAARPKMMLNDDMSSLLTLMFFGKVFLTSRNSDNSKPLLSASAPAV